MTTKAKSSTFEKSSVLAALLILVAIAVYLVSYYFKYSNVQTEEPYATNTPVTGSVAHVESISTGWVTKDGEEAIYPQATITLDSNQSKTGSIRVFFKKDVGSGLGDTKTIGDSNTFKITNGLFPNDTNSVTVTSTKGLASMADFLGYCAQDDSRWTVEVLEPSTDSNDFVEFAQAPIDTLLLEESK